MCVNKLPKVVTAAYLKRPEVERATSKSHHQYTPDSLKPAFHDADTDIAADIVARIVARECRCRCRRR